MVVKKETKEKKPVKPAVITKKSKKTILDGQQKSEKREEQFFAIDLAEKMGISSFDFLLIKREAGIEDGSSLSRSKMQELYDKIIKG